MILITMTMTSGSRAQYHGMRIFGLGLWCGPPSKWRPYPSPRALRIFARRVTQPQPISRNRNEAKRPMIGADHVLVEKYEDGMMFWICGVPGRATIAKEKMPTQSVAGSRRFGMSALRKTTAPNGYMTKATTKTERPPYVSAPQPRRTARTARFSPSTSTIFAATEEARPPFSIRRAKTAPNRKIG